MSFFLFILVQFVVLQKLYFASWSPHGGVYTADLDDYEDGTPVTPKSLVNEDNFPGISKIGVLSVEFFEKGIFFSTGNGMMYYGGLGDNENNFTLVYSDPNVDYIPVIKTLESDQGPMVFFVTENYVKKEKTLLYVNPYQFNLTKPLASWSDEEYDISDFQVRDFIGSKGNRNEENHFYLFMSTYLNIIQTRIFSVESDGKLTELFRDNGTAVYQAILSPNEDEVYIADFYDNQNGIWKLDYPSMTKKKTVLTMDEGYRLGYSIARNEESIFYNPSDWSRKCLVYRNDFFGETCMVSTENVSGGMNLMCLRIIKKD